MHSCKKLPVSKSIEIAPKFQEICIFLDIFSKYTKFLSESGNIHVIRFFSGIIHISWVYTFTVTYIRSISINFRDRGVSIINVGLLSLARCRTLHVGWNFHVCPNYFARSNSLTSFSIVTLYIVELWECVCHRLSIIRTNFLGVGGLRVCMLNYCILTPKALPFVYSLRVCWCMAF